MSDLDLKPLTEEDKKEAFIKAVNTIGGSRRRWKRRADTGLNDAELIDALRYEISTAGGIFGQGNINVQYQRSGLKIWASYGYPCPFKHKPLFEGSKTIAAARFYLNIHNPENNQPDLFGGA